MEHVRRVYPLTSLPPSRATLVREPFSRHSTLRTDMQSFTACRRRRSRRPAPSVSRGSSRCARDTRRSIRDVRRSQAPARGRVQRGLGRRSREPDRGTRSRIPGAKLCSAKTFLVQAVRPVEALPRPARKGAQTFDQAPSRCYRDSFSSQEPECARRPSARRRGRRRRSACRPSPSPSPASPAPSGAAASGSRP